MPAQKRVDPRPDRQAAERAATYALRPRVSELHEPRAPRRRTRGESLASVIERRRAVLLRLADS